jgi:hypothetical protein
MEKNFKIDKKIYSKKLVKKSIADFKNVSDISFDDGLLIIK